MTERLHFHFSLSCIGEGNGNPLQCSCLENPRDGKPGGLPSMGHTESDTIEATYSSSRLFIHLDTSHQLTHILCVLTLRTGWRFRMSRIQLLPLTSSGPRGVLTNKQIVQFSSVQSLSCGPMNRSMPGLPVHHQLLEFTETHIHRVSDAIQPSHPLSSPSPPAPNPS